MKIKDFTPCPDEIIKKYGIIIAAVYGKIYRYSQKEGFCFASQETIANDLGISRATVNKHIQQLLEGKYIIDLSPGIINRPHRYKPVFDGVKIFDSNIDYGVKIFDSTVNEIDSTVNEIDSTVKKIDAIKVLNKELKERKEDIDMFTTNKSEAWQVIKSQLYSQMEMGDYRTYVSAVDFLKIEGNDFIVLAPNENVRDWCKSRLTTTINDMFPALVNQEMNICFVIEAES